MPTENQDTAAAAAAAAAGNADTTKPKQIYHGKSNNLFALSIMNPWAQFIVDGIKPVENRSWHLKLTGVILIHASNTFHTEWRDCLSSKALQVANKYVSMKTISLKGRSPWTRAAIIGAAIITHSDDFYNSIWCQQGACFIWLSNPIKFNNPIPCKGKVKVFHPDIDIQQFSYPDKKALLELYDISKNLELQKLDISDFRMSQPITE